MIILNSYDKLLFKLTINNLAFENKLDFYIRRLFRGLLLLNMFTEFIMPMP